MTFLEQNLKLVAIKRHLVFLTVMNRKCIRLMFIYPDYAEGFI